MSTPTPLVASWAVVLLCACGPSIDFGALESGTEGESGSGDGDGDRGGAQPDGGDGDGGSDGGGSDGGGSDGGGSGDGATAACGDGHLDASEGCDDGNVVNGDGCSATCQPSGTIAWTVALPQHKGGFAVVVDTDDQPVVSTYRVDATGQVGHTPALVAFTADGTQRWVHEAEPGRYLGALASRSIGGVTWSHWSGPVDTPWTIEQLDEDGTVVWNRVTDTVPHVQAILPRGDGTTILAGPQGWAVRYALVDDTDGAIQGIGIRDGIAFETGIEHIAAYEDRFVSLQGNPAQAVFWRDAPSDDIVLDGLPPATAGPIALSDGSYAYLSGTYTLVRFDPSGETEAQELSGSWGALAPTPGGDVLVAGEIDEHGAIATVTPDGTMRWTTVLPDTYVVSAVTADSTGTVYAASASRGTNGEEVGDLMLTRVDG